MFFLLRALLLTASLLADDGPYVDPNGGGAMDPNGVVSDDGVAIDPHGSRICYTGCVDPNG